MVRICTVALLMWFAQAGACQTGHGSLTGNGNQKRHTHDHTLLSLTVSPTSAARTVGGDAGFAATAHFSDNTTQDVTTSAAWLSLSTGVVTVGSSSDPWPMHCVGAGTSTIVATYNGFSGQGTLTCTAPTVPTLSSITVTPVNPTQYDGLSVGFTATGTYSDGSKQNITSSVTWASGTPAVGTVGPLTATESGNCLTTGSTVITATDPTTGVNGTTTLTCVAVPVTLNSIAVTPANTTIYTGTAQNFTATGTYSDGSTQNLTASAAWSSSNTAVATVGPLTTTEAGNCLTAGTVTITASFGGKSGTTNLTCQVQVVTPTLASIALNPQNPSAYNGSSDSFTATCTYSDASTRPCTTSDPLTSTATVWASATPAVATLGALTTTQTVNCLTTGTSSISATIGAISGSTTQTCAPPPVTLNSISVTPANPTQYNGSAVAFTATGNYSDGSTQNLTSSASWTSGTPAVATIAANVVTCVANSGTSLITATFNAVSGNTTLTCATAPAAPVGENGYCSSNTDASCFTGNLTDCVTGTNPNGNTVTVCAQLPTHGMYTALDGTPAPGTVKNLSCPGNLAAAQADLNGMAAGDTLIYPAGCTITGQLTFPVVPGADAAHWNIIEVNQAGFPAEHTRITPCSNNQATLANFPTYPCASPSDQMVHLTCTSGSSCLKVAAGANHFRYIGYEIFANPSGSNNVSNVVDLSAGADHVIGDRLLIHGPTFACSQTNNVYACTSNDVAHGWTTGNSTDVALVNSEVYNIACPQGTCTDATGVGLGGNGASSEDVKKLFNNLISAAGEDYLAGGGGQGFGSTTLTPNDFEIRENFFFKPAIYAFKNGANGQHPEFKNNGELKNANRVLIEGNVYENSWAGWQTDQAGFNSLLTPKNQSSKSGGNATVTAGGAATATSGTFLSNVVSAGCANPGHCTVSFQSGTYSCQAQTFTDATHISVGASCSPAIPAAGLANVQFTACAPGLNPTATVTNVTYRWNDFRNSKNGIQLGAGTSDCSDKSAGIHDVVVHDNLLEGVNTALSNAKSPGTGQQCFEIFNGQASPNQIDKYGFAHNTCAQAVGLPNSFAGLDFTLDTTATTTDGSTGSYLDNSVIVNNIGPAGGVTGYRSGTFYPGGQAAGVKQWGCTPAVSGGTCTWVYARNVLGQGQWNRQFFNSPFPSSNQTCDSAGTSCFPTGAAFTNLFTQYNSGSGQPGYRGVYTLAGTFQKSGTDGLDIGVSNWTRWNQLQTGVRSDTTYTAAAISTASPLPAATHGVAYSTTFSGTSASDFQYWTNTDNPATCAVGVTGNCIPAGMSLSLAGVLSGTPSTAGSYTIHMQMMDAAQQYATKTFSLTVN